jgi:hypothetical protein
VAFGLVAVLAAGPGLGAQPVDLELVLAVDASSSISTGEFELQMVGLAEAFRHPAVAEVIETLAPRGIAVALMQWSSETNQVVAVDWTHVADAADARALAARIEGVPRRVGGGATAIGSALEVAIALIAANDFTGQRRSIDLSGDGVSNQGAAPSLIRDQAIALGITINGLAILKQDPNLDRYYRATVIGGPRAFVMTADRYRDFGPAMLRKLIREIGAPPLAERPVPYRRAAIKSAQDELNRSARW